jgi:hypothetical protein
MKKWCYTGLALLVLIVSVLVVSSASAYTTDFPKSYRLWQGSAAMHEIGVYGSCGTQITVQSPYGAAFDLYAMKNYGSPGTCPSNEYIMSHYDKYAFSSGSGGSATLYLEEGLWCVVVYARSGSGTAYVTADSNCFRLLFPQRHIHRYLAHAVRIKRLIDLDSLPGSGCRLWILYPNGWTFTN